MAKHTRRKYWKRKGRWSANISRINQSESVSGGTTYTGIYLCSNPAQSYNSVSQQYTVKNIEISLELELAQESSTGVSSTQIEDLQYFVMYVPQGMSPTHSYPIEHPEYIMAYRYKGSPLIETNDSSNDNPLYPVFIKSRMARRLQTGDKILLLVCWNTQGNFPVGTLNARGIVRWWTKAN